MKIDVYFKIPPSQVISEHEIMLVSDDGLRSKKLKNVAKLYQDSEKVYVVHRLDRGAYEALKKELTAEPLTLDAVYELKINNSYVGRSIEDLLTYDPELAGYDEYLDEEGNTQQRPKIQAVEIL